MSDPDATPPGPIRRAVRRKIERRPTRRIRATVFQAYVLIATGVFVALAVTAHYVPYFPIDLVVTRFFQTIDNAVFDAIMNGLTWMGFVPQVDLIVALVVSVLFLLGLRWEAVAALFAALGPVLGSVIKVIVARPRPTGDLVEVLTRLDTLSFPSGHVLLASTFYGFIAFLAYTLLKPGWIRTALLVLFGAIIALMGPSRIYLGHHWFSDVMGAYVLGSLWLALAIRTYRWGKPRFSRTQAVAPESSAGKDPQ